MLRDEEIILSRLRSSTLLTRTLRMLKAYMFIYTEQHKTIQRLIDGVQSYITNAG